MGAGNITSASGVHRQMWEGIRDRAFLWTLENRNTFKRFKKTKLGYPFSTIRRFVSSKRLPPCVTRRSLSCGSGAWQHPGHLVPLSRPQIKPVFRSNGYCGFSIRLWGSVFFEVHFNTWRANAAPRTLRPAWPLPEATPSPPTPPPPESPPRSPAGPPGLQ